MYIQSLFYFKGGNQREKSREKAAKKQKEVEKTKKSSEKGANKGMTLDERRHRFVMPKIVSSENDCYKKF